MFFIHGASAATYYVSVADGNDTSCTGLATTTYVSGAGQPCPWKTLSKVNTAMGAATIHAGDSILFKRGETFAGYLNVTVTGTVGNILTFGDYGTGAKPIIDATGNANGVDIRTSKQYIDFNNLDVRSATTRAFFIYNSADHLNINDCSVTGTAGVSTNTGSFSYITFTNFIVVSDDTKIGFNLAGTEITHLTLTNVNVTHATYGIYTSATSLSSFLIENSNFGYNSTIGIYIARTSGLEINDTVTSNNTQNGVALGNSSEVIANVTINGLTAESNGAEGLVISSSAGSNITIRNSAFNFNVNSNGISFLNTGDNVLIENSVASNNDGDGFNVHGAWTNVVLDGCTGNSNGKVGLSGSGDGFSFHDTSGGTMRKCIAKENKKSSVAHVTAGTITMENCLFSHTTNGTIPLVALYNGTYYLYNNIIYSPAQIGVGLSFGNDATTLANGTVKNNIISGFATGFQKVEGVTGTITNSHNLVYNSGTNAYSGLTPGVGSLYPSYNPLFTDISSLDFSLQPISLAIDAGTTTSNMTSTTTDYTGTNPIYGTPDIGAYEYQPPYVITANHPQYSGNIRIYGDGRYQYTTATTTTTTANFSVVPAEGSFAAHQTFDAIDTRPEWLNISDITWGATKQFTASSSIATTTIYTVGDLTPNVYYTVTRDSATTTLITGASCINGICQTGSEGKIIFTYTGGYSTHTFALTPDTTSPTPGLIDFPSITTTSITASSTGATDNIALAALPYLYHNMTSDTYSSITSSSWTVTGLTPSTNYTFEVGVKDLAGNWATSTMYTVSTPAPAIVPSGGANGSRNMLYKFLPPIIQLPISTITTPTTASPSVTFKINRAFGNTGSDIKALQIYLNIHGYNIAKTGAGSPSHETNYFGPATRAALIKFQKANNITPAVGYFGPVTRGVVNAH